MRVERDPVGDAERVHPQPQGSRGGDLRVLLAERARRRVPRVRERPLLGRRAAARSARSNAVTGKYISPRTSITAGGSSSASVRGTPSTVRTFAVMSSPTRPSPRVAALTRTPALVGERAGDPVDLQLAREPRARLPPRARPAAAHASSSSNENALSSESIGARCVDRREQVAPAPHRPSGWASRASAARGTDPRARAAHASARRTRRRRPRGRRARGSGSGGARPRPGAPRRGASPRRARVRRRGPTRERSGSRRDLHAAGHPDLARPTTTTPPRTPGTCWR